MLVFQKYMDKYMGAILVLFLSLFKRKEKTNPTPQKFLVIKLWALGDCVISLALVRGLRESFPEGTVDVLTRTSVKDVFESYPVDQIYNMDAISDLKQLFRSNHRYDVVFDCEPYFNISAIIAYFMSRERIGFADQFRSRLYTTRVKFRKDQHMVQNYLDMLRVLGIEYDTPALENLTVRAQDKIAPDDLLSAQMPDKKTLIGISPGVGRSSKNRMWFEERFAALSDRMIENLNVQVIFIDSEENSDVVDRIISLMEHQPINAAGRFTLKETFYVISKCDIYISNDTGPMHVAAAQGCKTIGLFGPNTPTLWAPYGKHNISIYKTDLEPAIQNDKGIFKEGNREGYMGVIQVDDVLQAVEHLI